MPRLALQKIHLFMFEGLRQLMGFSLGLKIYATVFTEHTNPNAGVQHKGLLLI